MRKSRIISKKIIALTTVVAMTVSSMAVTAFAETDYSRYDRLSQPSYSYTFAKDELAVVNFHPVWGDTETNVASMIEYVEEANEKGTKILLFPEMCVTGYASSSNSDSETYKMPIENAETLDGPTQQTFSVI